MEYKVDRHRINNIEVGEYLEKHKDCPYYEKAVKAIKIADGCGVVVGASVVSKHFFGISHRQKTKRCTVGKRMVSLHPTMGVIIKFITQSDLDLCTIGPIRYHCNNFLVDEKTPE